MAIYRARFTHEGVTLHTEECPDAQFAEPLKRKQVAGLHASGDDLRILDAFTSAKAFADLAAENPGKVAVCNCVEGTTLKAAIMRGELSI